MEMRGVGGGGDEGQICQKLSPHGNWRCNLTAVSGEIYCEKHFLRAQRDGEVRETQNMGNGGESCGGNGGSRNRKRDEGKRGAFNGGGSERGVDFGENGGRVRNIGRVEGSNDKGKKNVLKEKDGRIRGDRRGSPKDSNNQKRIDVGCETEGMQVDDQSDVELVGMKDKGKIVWCKDDEVFGGINEDGINSVGVGVGPSNSQENSQSNHGLNKDISRNVGDGIAGGFSGDSVKSAPVQMVRGRGRPKGSKNKKQMINEAEREDVVEGIIERRRELRGKTKMAPTAEVFQGDDDSENYSSDDAELVSAAEVAVCLRNKEKYGHGSSKNKVKNITVERNEANCTRNQKGEHGRHELKRKQWSAYDFGEFSEFNKVEKRPRAVSNANVNESHEPACMGEKVPFGNVKKKSSAAGMSDAPICRSTCHQCLKSNKGSVVTCSNCKTKGNCYECIAKWYPERTKKEFGKSCPFCCKNCNCKACLQEDVELQGCTKEADENIRLQRSLYLLVNVLPILRHIQLEQRTELDVETSIRGVQMNEEDVQLAVFEEDDRVYCNNCKTSIVNFHRSCPHTACSYDLCLDCCSELRKGIQPGGLETRSKRKGSSTYKTIELGSTRGQVDDMGVGFCKWEAKNDGSIPCPPEVHGGCGADNLALRRILSANWVDELIKTAEDITCNYRLPNIDFSEKCPSCFAASTAQDDNDVSEVRKASGREYSQDNFLYCPNAVDMGDSGFEHFQKHWRKGEPVIVRNVHKTATGLSWEPMVMLRAFMQARN